MRFACASSGSVTRRLHQGLVSKATIAAGSRDARERYPTGPPIRAKARGGPLVWGTSAGWFDSSRSDHGGARFLCVPYKSKAQHSAYCNARMRASREAWISANGPCRRCGSTVELQVDHIDRNQKLSHKVWSWSQERRAAELAKCQVLCRECHESKSAREREPEHGTNSRYTSQKWRCKCSLCRAAHAAVNRALRHTGT